MKNNVNNTNPVVDQKLDEILHAVNRLRNGGSDLTPEEHYAIIEEAVEEISQELEQTKEDIDMSKEKVTIEVDIKALFEALIGYGDYGDGVLEEDEVNLADISFELMERLEDKEMAIMKAKNALTNSGTSDCSGEELLDIKNLLSELSKQIDTNLKASVEQEIDMSNKVVRCNRCDSLVAKSEVTGYSYQCFECDEDLYGVEVTIEDFDPEEEVCCYQVNKHFGEELVKNFSGFGYDNLDGTVEGRYANEQEAAEQTLNPEFSIRQGQCGELALCTFYEVETYAMKMGELKELMEECPHTNPLDLIAANGETIDSYSDCEQWPTTEKDLLHIINKDELMLSEYKALDELTSYIGRVLDNISNERYEEIDEQWYNALQMLCDTIEEEDLYFNDEVKQVVLDYDISFQDLKAYCIANNSDQDFLLWSAALDWLLTKAFKN